jgi:hypothetical protein
MKKQMFCFVAIAIMGFSSCTELKQDNAQIPLTVIGVDTYDQKWNQFQPKDFVTMLAVSAGGDTMSVQIPVGQAMNNPTPFQVFAKSAPELVSIAPVSDTITVTVTKKNGRSNVSGICSVTAVTKSGMEVQGQVSREVYFQNTVPFEAVLYTDTYRFISGYEIEK